MKVDSDHHKNVSNVKNMIEAFVINYENLNDQIIFFVNELSNNIVSLHFHHLMKLCFGLKLMRPRNFQNIKFIFL
jgi:hypothetical protein